MALPAERLKTLIEQYGTTWRHIEPTLQLLALAGDRQMEADEIASIDLAVFTSDLWSEGRGPSFYKVLLQAPQPQWLHVFAAGTDHPVFAEIRRRGIRLTHSAGASAIPATRSC